MVGTPGHLRIPEAYEMAEELEEYIGTLDGKVFSCIGIGDEFMDMVQKYCEQHLKDINNDKF